MSTTRASYIYRPNVPEFIQRQIQQLHEKETRIVELEAELGQLRKDHAQLERDLEPYRVGSSLTDITSVQRIPLEPTHIKTASINQCPDEILCLIFDNCVLDQWSHPFISRLLRVCRRWYMLVRNTAKLWAQIDFYILDLFDIGNLQFSYIFACLNRSKNLPITVYLDMEDLSHNWIARRLQIQDGDFLSILLDSQLDPVIERLVGVDGEHMKRWETMTLYLPEDEDIGIRVWNIVARGFKAVKNIVIYNFPSPPPDIFMPDFGSVKNFGLDYVDDAERCPITRFGLLPSTLKYLDIEVRNPSIDIAELSDFQELRTLRLVCLAYKDNLRESFEFSISLPHLERLILVAESGILARVRFDLSSLDLLRFEDCGVNKPLPAIHPRHIQASMQSGLSRIELKKVIHDYIFLSNALECITIDHPLEKDDVKGVVAQIKLEGKASSLTQIIVEHKKCEVEKIYV